jgi:hypothetical protein
MQSMKKIVMQKKTLIKKWIDKAKANENRYFFPMMANLSKSLYEVISIIAVQYN